jgi:hypothetical protein
MEKTIKIKYYCRVQYIFHLEVIMNFSRLNRFLFAVLFVTLAVSAWAQAGNRYALVIGNAEYQRIDKLKNTINDARDISAALQSLGYQVDLKLNLGHLQMVDAIEAFTTKLAGNRANEGFFWYAGHAVQIQDENYLLPVDITVDTVSRVRAGSFSLNNLIDMLDTAKNKVNVLILDACRDNPLPTAGRGGGGRGLAMIRDVPSDLFVMFSTAPGNKADDGAAGKRNSPFAEAFLKYIKSNEPVYQMAIDVTQETLKLTDQRQRPFQRGSIISEKYYSLNPQTVQPTPSSGYRIGDRGPAGGIIFYDKGNTNGGWRYLEAAPVNMEYRAQWGAYEKNVPGTSTEIGSGKSNTQMIVDFLKSTGESGKAAQLCANLNFGGYNDWFLPSKDELDLIYRNLISRNIGNFKTTVDKTNETHIYWSSSQYNNYVSWFQNFNDGYQNYAGSLGKYDAFSVRPIRAF